MSDEPPQNQPSVDEWETFVADMKAADAFVGLGGADWDDCLRRVLARMAVQQHVFPWIETADGFSRRCRGASVIWQRTGKVDGLLESFGGVATRPLSTLPGGTKFYLSVLLILAYAGLALFAFFTAPRIDSLRRDLELVSVVDGVAESSLQHSTVVALAVIPLVFLVIAVGVGLRGSWCGLPYRPNRSPQSRARGAGVAASRRRTRGTGVVLRLVDRLMVAGVPFDEAIRWAADWIGGGPGMMNAPEMPRLNVRPRLVADAIEIAELQRVQRLARWASPASIILVGGTVAISYGLTLFWPLVTLLTELSRAGV